MLTGDFGESFFYKRPVAMLIADRIEPTLALTITTITLATLLAVPLGTLAAYRQGSWIDRGVMAFSVLSFSVPVFVIGYCLIWLLSVKLGWFPVQGYQSIADGFGGFIHRLILPTLSLATIYIALIARMTRTSVLEVLNEDYVRTARAKGLPELKVVLGHALRNAAVPIVTVIGVGIALLIGGVVVTESVFNIPGPRAAHGGCGAGARLPHRAGGHHAVLGRLRADQPGHRPALHRARSADPLLTMAQR